MAINNVVLLTSTQGKMSVTGPPVSTYEAARAGARMYTIAITTSNLTGRLFIEGTLQVNPTDDDWFTIRLPGIEDPFIQYPYEDAIETATILGFNFNGSFTYVRARLDRDYLISHPFLTEEEIAIYGFVDQIVLNLGTWRAD
jgi:hypothetical protein